MAVPSNKNMGTDRQEALVRIPHFPLDDAITPSDLQNLLVYGNGYALQTLANIYNGKLELIRAKHDATHHHLDWGALNGLVLDASGRVPLRPVYDLRHHPEAWSTSTSTTPRLMSRPRTGRPRL